MPHFPDAFLMLYWFFTDSLPMLYQCITFTDALLMLYWCFTDALLMPYLAHQVQRMMPGGLMVMGIFFFCPSEQVPIETN